MAFSDYHLYQTCHLVVQGRVSTGILVLGIGAKSEQDIVFAHRAPLDKIQIGFGIEASDAILPFVHHHAVRNWIFQQEQPGMAVRSALNVTHQLSVREDRTHGLGTALSHNMKGHTFVRLPFEPIKFRR